VTGRLVIAAAIIAVGVALPQYQEDPVAAANNSSRAAEAPVGRDIRGAATSAGRMAEDAGAIEGARTDHSGVRSTDRIGTVLLGGRASWFGARGNIAAAGPALRDFLGPHWRGTLVRVTSATGQAVVVRLSDWCKCPHGRLIDLSDDAFRQLAPLSVGVLGVTIQRIGRSVAPPPTDTDG
jgi:hypothetical protein